MNYLLVKEADTKYKLYDPELFGSDTWGMSYQTSLEKKRKYWYITHWTAGNDYEDDRVESERLNVVLETPSLQQVLNYVVKETKNNQAVIGSILVQAQGLYHERVEFENWAKNRRGDD